MFVNQPKCNIYNKVIQSPHKSLMDLAIITGTGHWQNANKQSFHRQRALQREQRLPSKTYTLKGMQRAQRP